MAAEIDFETRSEIDIKIQGAYVYAQHPSTDALTLSYKINGGPVRRWLRGAPCPADLRAHVETGREVQAHNIAFDRLIWNCVMHARYGWPLLRIEQCRCSAATAAALSLPRSLGDLGAALGLDIQKDKRGTNLIQKFCKPRRARCNAKIQEDPGKVWWNEPEDNPEDWDALLAYCDTDVESEHAATSRMVPLPDDELDLWRISERINDRGMLIDVQSARAALALADRAKDDLNPLMAEATSGAVTSCSQVTALTAWVQSRGVPIPSAAAADIEDALAGELPADVRRALELRQEAAKTSVAKLKSFLARVSPDGRLRGAFLYHAAGTGRWSSVGAQVHNLPRPRASFCDAHLDPETLFRAIRTRDPGALSFLYGPELGRPLHLLSDAIRGFITAAPGHDLIDADYSGIEGAVAAWFCGEDWKTQAIADIAADPSLPDLYRRAAAGIFNVDVAAITKKDPRRQVGKVSELSLQYQGGPGAFRSMARNYSMKLDPIYDPVWEAATEARRAAAEKRWRTVQGQNAPISRQLTEREFLAAELVKIGWRETHPAISGSWQALQDAAHKAVAFPGATVNCLKVAYLYRRGFLWCRLPSGRCLAYGAPKVKEQVWVRRPGDTEDTTMGRAEAEALAAVGGCSIARDARPAVTVLGVDSVTRRLMRYPLYGGLLLENNVQAIARDLLANGIRKAEAAGYPVIAHVHDEIVSEVPEGWGDVGEFERLICELPPWAAGLPLTAGGWRGKRFKKD